VFVLDTNVTFVFYRKEVHVVVVRNFQSTFAALLPIDE
jgi:hypothetical protein